MGVGAGEAGEVIEVITSLYFFPTGSPFFPTTSGMKHFSQTTENEQTIIFPNVRNLEVHSQLLKKDKLIN